jgi:hypothetical protein
MKKKILVFLWIQHKKKDVFFYTWYGFPLYLYYLNIEGDRDGDGDGDGDGILFK